MNRIQLWIRACWDLLISSAAPDKHKPSRLRVKAHSSSFTTTLLQQLDRLLLLNTYCTFFFPDKTENSKINTTHLPNSNNEQWDCIPHGSFFLHTFQGSHLSVHREHRLKCRIMFITTVSVLELQGISYRAVAFTSFNHMHLQVDYWIKDSRYPFPSCWIL